MLKPSARIGLCLAVYPGVRGIGADPDHSGHVGGYQDVYVKTPQGWRFKSRLHVFPPLVPGTVKLSDVERLVRPPAK